MKKILFLALVALCACMSAAAQEYNDFFTFRPDKKVRKNVINISYLSDKIELSDKGVNLGDIFDEAAGIARGTNVGARSNWGVSLTYVHTYMLHRKPIARMLGFGLDVSFADVSYANYTIDNMDNWGMIDPDDFDTEHDPTKRLDVPMHKVEYSLQIGPSVTLTPGRNFTFTGYVRYAPSFSGIYINYDFYGNYASMFNIGASASWRNIGVGIEARMGGCRYKDFTGGEALTPAKLKTSGYRACLQIRW